MKAARIMWLYAGFILACSLAAFIMAADKSRATTALYAGGGSAVLVFICGVMARMIYSNKMVGMIGIHAGLVLPLLLGGLFGFRAYKSYTGPPDRQYLAVIFALMAAASLVAFIMILKARPPMAARSA